MSLERINSLPSALSLDGGIAQSMFRAHLVETSGKAIAPACDAKPGVSRARCELVSTTCQPRSPSMEPVVDPSVFHPKLGRPDQALPKRGTLVAERYRVGDGIGEGGMSTVFSARDERLGRDVALKLLNPEL